MRRVRYWRTVFWADLIWRAIAVCLILVALCEYIPRLGALTLGSLFAHYLHFEDLLQVVVLISCTLPNILIVAQLHSTLRVIALDHVDVVCNVLYLVDISSYLC